METTNDEFSKISELLRLLGLSYYEAQGFAALVYHGIADADTVADSAKIPRTSAYKVMESLVEKGFAKETQGRPRMFKPEDMNKIRNEFTEKIDDLFRRLKALQDVLPSKGEPQLIYTIHGTDKVYDKIKEMINLTERELIICTPRIRDIRTAFKKNIENAVKRGVKIIFITPPNKRVPSPSTVYRKEGLIATDVVSDQERAMLAAPEMDACGYSDNPALVAHVFQFVNMMMNGETPKTV
ncbi:MAG: TrmB family transcriptional regulator [Thermoplasmatales archaeon]|nr:TrmB family transcriptional regulator [Thermoplasmatales archaeon]MCW6170069.1 TrmB family transcriptional regulator [Thermoplasmatales archaeon]